MSRPTGSPTVRRALAIHAAWTLLVACAVTVVASILAVVMTTSAARASAASVADVVAHAVAGHLQTIDGSIVEDRARASVLAELQPFLDAGVIERAKIWQVDGDEAVVLFSDEPRNEGARRPFDPDLADRLDRGEVVVLEMPDDLEHQHEAGQGDLIEAFIGYTDAAGTSMRLELYLASTVSHTLPGVLVATLVPTALGPLLLGAATLPLALRLARRVERREAERRNLLHAALTASDRERRRLAGRLHDGVVQDLASLGLTLDHLGSRSAEQYPQQAAALSHAVELLDTELAELRQLLTELAPPELEQPLEVALHDLADDLSTPRTRIDLELAGPVAASPEAAALTYRIARELVRNAIEHARPERIVVSLRRSDDLLLLSVTDDGTGFDPSLPAPEGHLGLRLVRYAALDSGGSFELHTGAGGTRAEARLNDPQPAALQRTGR
ncbi:MAG: histidine kinase [Propionicimonas sp.]